MQELVAVEEGLVARVPIQDMRAVHLCGFQVPLKVLLLPMHLPVTAEPEVEVAMVAVSFTAVTAVTEDVGAVAEVAREAVQQRPVRFL